MVHVSISVCNGCFWCKIAGITKISDLIKINKGQWISILADQAALHFVLIIEGLVRGFKGVI